MNDKEKIKKMKIEGNFDAQRRDRKWKTKWEKWKNEKNKEIMN